MSLLPYASLTHRRRAYRSTGDVVLIQSQTASNSASITFSSGITSTYGEYIFGFYNLNPATDSKDFQFQVNVAGESGYNETITSTHFRVTHDEADSATTFGYQTSHDQAQGTSYQNIINAIGNGADESGAGILHLFSPSNTTYVTHFYCTGQMTFQSYSAQTFAAGYINVTGAVDEISFKMASGNFDGVIQMYGIS